MKTPPKSVSQSLHRLSLVLRKEGELDRMTITYQEEPEKKMLSDPKIEVLIDAHS